MLDQVTDRQGFVLIELLVAVALFGLLAVPVMATFVSGYLSLAGAGNRTHALNLARQQMEQVKSMGYAGAYLYYIEQGNSPQENKMGPFTLEIQVVAEPACLEKPATAEILDLELLRIRVAVSWGEAEEGHSLQLVSPVQPVRAGEMTGEKNRGLEKGFTLIEILVALVITGLVFSGIYTLYLWGIKTWQKGILRMDNQQNARIAMDYLVEELRFASAVQINSPHEIKFWFKGSPKTHIFRLAGEEIVFETKNGYSSHNKIALGVTGLSFEQDGSGCIFIAVTCGSGNEMVKLNSSIRPRNLP